MLAVALTVLSACPPRGDVVLVDTAHHRMELCTAGTAQHSYDIAHGSGGAAQVARRIGWAVTPLGRFTLAAPIPSSQFHVVVPLKNPAPDRFTAWAIGLHGPPRSSRTAGHLNVESDWTWGCIAVSTDAEIDEVARWIRARKVTSVEFR